MITAIVQARMTSTRLPGKVMLPLLSGTIISHVFNQLSFSKCIDQIILATSIDRSDFPLVEWARNEKIKYYRGNLNDVLDRYYNAAKYYNSTTIVRITADCPLIDPEIVDKVITEYRNGKYDYISNSNPPTYPDGLDVEVFSFAVLKNTWENANKLSEREHVTLFIKNHPDKFKLGNYENTINLSSYRWTVDQVEDYSFIQTLVKEIKYNLPYLRMKDVLDYINDHKRLTLINQNIKRNQGLLRSLANDKDIYK